MATAVRTQSFSSVRTQTKQEPKSKIMLWRQENPKGMGIIVDMRKVLK